MSEQFDPYYEWLGIPPRDQPPSHYRLLGIETFESNPRVIEHAADRQMAHIRTLQSGKRAAESQQLLNEISAAKVCLLNEDRKTEYDKSLPSEVDSSPKKTAEPPVAPQPPAPVIVGNSARSARKPFPIGLVAIICLSAIVVVGGIIFLVVQSRKNSGDGDKKVAAKKNKGGKGKKGEKKKKAKSDGNGKKHVIQPGQGKKKKTVLSPNTKKKKGNVNKRKQKGSGKKKSSSETVKQRETSITRPVPTEISQQVESARGVVHKKFALCQTMALADYLVVAKELGRYGYRPIRCRPYQTLMGLRLAALWLRDGKPWSITAEASPAHLKAIDEGNRIKGLWPVDVAGYYHQQTRYIGIWGKPADVPTDAKIFVGELSGRVRQKTQPSAADGFVPVTRHDFVDKERRRVVNQIWYKPSLTLKGIRRTMNNRAFSRMTATTYYPTDVCIQPRNSRIRSMLYGTCGREDKTTPYRTVYGARATRMVGVSSKLADEGFVPAALSVVKRNRMLYFASIWHWPAGVPVPAALVRKPTTAPPTTVIKTNPPKNPFTPTTAGRQPAPSDEDLAKAFKEIDSVFKVSRAKTTIKKAGVADELFQQAGEEKDAATLFMLLKTAGRLFAESEKLNFAMQAADELGRRYIVDTLALKATYLKKLNLAKNESVRHSVAESAQKVAEASFKTNKFDQAIELYGIAQSSWRRVRLPRLASHARRRGRQIGTGKKYWEQAESARKKLASEPGDKVAHLALGKYLVAVQGDWAKGVPHLIKGSETRLADLATKDSAQPTDAMDQLSLADAWYKWAEASKSIDQIAGYRRAQHWYNTCYSNVSGVLRRKVDKQLKVLDDKLEGLTPSDGRKLPWLDNKKEGVIRYFLGHSDRVTCVATSRRGRLMVSAGEKKQLYVWELSTGRKVHQLICSIDRLSTAVITPDERYVIAGGEDKNGLGIWDLRKGRPVGSIGTIAPIRVMSLSSNGRRLLCALTDSKGTVGVIDPASRKIRLTFKTSRKIHSVAISQNGQMGAICGYRHLQLWDLGSGRMLRPLQGHTRSTIGNVAISPDGQYVASMDSRDLRIWDANKGTQLHSFRIVGGRCLIFSPNSKRLIVGTYRSRLRIFDVETGTQTGLLEDKVTGSNAIFRIAFLPDPRGLITASSDKKVRLWRLPD